MSWQGWQKLHMLIGFSQEWKALTKPKQRIRNNIQKQILNTLTNLPYNSGLFEFLLGLLLLITHDSLPDFTTSTPSCACDEKKKTKWHTVAFLIWFVFFVFCGSYINGPWVVVLVILCWKSLKIFSTSTLLAFDRQYDRGTATPHHISQKYSSYMYDNNAKKVAKYCNTSISSQNFFMFRANNLEITIKNLLMTINSGNFQFRQNIQNAVKPVLSGHP